MRRLLLGILLAVCVGGAAQGATTAGRDDLLPLGSQAPDFTLPDVATGKTLSLSDFKGRKGLLVMFICRHCPYVKHVQEELARMGRDFQVQRIGVVAISANDPAGVPEDAPESLKEQAQQLSFTFPYLFDETQETAKAYGAVCTPDFFLFDGQQRLVYRGQMDGSRPGGKEAVTGKDLRAAVEALAAGRPVPAEQKPSEGCSIKWKR